MRLTVALVVTAAALAYWATQNTRSFLLVFLVTLAWTALALGIGTVVGAISREQPPETYSDDDLEWIESHEQYLRALDNVTRRPS